MGEKKKEKQKQRRKRRRNKSIEEEKGMIIVTRNINHKTVMKKKMTGEKIISAPFSVSFIFKLNPFFYQHLIVPLYFMLYRSHL